MAAAAASIPAASPTGYEAFLRDADAPKMSIAEIREKIPSPTAAASPAQKAPAEDDVREDRAAEAPEEEEGREEIVAEGVDVSPKEDDPTVVTEDGKATAGQEVQIASAANEGEAAMAKDGAAGWADKWSCNLPCGTLDVEFMKDDEPVAPTEQGEDALKEQGELPMLEAGEEAKVEAPPAKPWGERASKTAHTWLVKMGLASKKEQKLITDFYKAKPASKKETSTGVPAEDAKEGKDIPKEAPGGEAENTLLEKMAEVQASVSQSLAAMLDGSVLDPSVEEKGMKQTLMTDFDPAKLKEKEAAAKLAAKGIPSVVEATVEEEKVSLWAKVKSFFGRSKAPSCDAVHLPEVLATMPTCDAWSNFQLPKAEDSGAPTGAPADKPAAAEGWRKGKTPW